MTTFISQLVAKYPSLNFDATDNNKIKGFERNSNNSLEVASNHSQLCYLGHLGLINLVGDDAADFLHKQLTNDVLHLTEGIARHAAWCSAKGRMLASLITYRQGESIRLLLSKDLAEQTSKRLQMYILRAKAKASDISNQVEILGLMGETSEQTLLSAGLNLPSSTERDGELNTATTGDVTVICLAAQRFIVVIPAPEALTYWEKFAEHATPTGTPTWEWHDIQDGLPVISLPTREAFVPQMVDFDLLGGVNFKKGCYPGQEIVARTHYLGKVKRHLYRVTSKALIVPGQELHSPASPDQAVGMIISAVEQTEGSWVGLASILETAAENLLPSMHTSRVFNEPPQQ